MATDRRRSARGMLAAFFARAAPHATRQFTLLGFPAIAQAYYIRCVDCVSLFATDADFSKMWQKEEAAVQKGLIKAGLA